MKKKIVLTAVLTVQVLLIVAGCSHERSKLASVEDACALLLKADAETLLDAPAGTPESAKSNYKGTERKDCSYRSTQGPDAVVLSIVIPGSDVPSHGRDQAFESRQKLLGPSHKLEKVEGYLDGAIWQGSVGDFIIFEGNNHLKLSLRRVNTTDSRSKVEAVAKALVRRLG